MEPGAPIASSRTVSSKGVTAGLAEGPFNGWSVIEASDLNAAANLLADHPFIGRGGVLQINEPAGI